MSRITNWIKKNFDGRHEGNEYRINCPFCSGLDTGHHMYVSLRKPVAHCFKCTWSGTHFTLVKEYLGAESYAETWAAIDHTISSMADYSTVVERLERREEREIPININRMPDWYVPFSGDPINCHGILVLDYALTRLRPVDILRLGVGYCDDPEQITYRWRMVVPVEHGHFQARAIGKFKPKYINPPTGTPGAIFNPNALVVAKTLYVAEGILSAVALGSDAIAVLGSAATREQAARIACSKVRDVVLAFDADASDSKSVHDLATHLVAHGKNVMIRKYAEGDPDSCEVYSDTLFSTAYQVRSRLFAGEGA